MAMDLQSIILNLFRIFTAYFPCPREIPSTFFHTSIGYKVVHHIQVLHLELSSKSPSCNFNEFLFSVRNKSSTYNKSIIGLLPSTLKQRLESALLSVNPRVISNMSILSYHVEPQDLLQSLPLKRSIILPLPFILYALKHYVPEWQVASFATNILCIHLGSLDTKILYLEKVILAPICELVILYRLSSSTLYQRLRSSSL